MVFRIIGKILNNPKGFLYILGGNGTLQLKIIEILTNSNVFLNYLRGYLFARFQD